MAPNRLTQYGFTLFVVFSCFLAWLSANWPGPEKISLFETNLVTNITAPEFGFGIKVPIPFGRRNDLSYLEFINNTAGSRLGQGLFSSLEKRATDWATALNDGRVMQLMLNDPRTQSHWGTMTQLTQSGWIVNDFGADVVTGDYDDVYPDLEPKGTVERSGGNLISVFHQLRFTKCRFGNIQIQPSRARYQNVYNVQAGMIVGVYNFGPEYELRQLAIRDRATVEYDANGNLLSLEDKIPDLHAWSDAVGMAWIDRAGPHAASLRYIFKHDVTTGLTVSILKEVAGRSDAPQVTLDATSYYELPWPGKTFASNTLEFRALLGTPHGKGIVWLLVQHPNEMPGKMVESITIFTTRASYHNLWHMLFILSI